MGLLDAGSCGCCLRWPARASGTVHRQVGHKRHGRCALASARCPRDGNQLVTDSHQNAGRPVGRRRPASQNVLVSSGNGPWASCKAPSGVSRPFGATGRVRLALYGQFRRFRQSQCVGGRLTFPCCSVLVQSLDTEAAPLVAFPWRWSAGFKR